MKTSENGKNLIRNFEGLRLNAYKCPSGRLTIGYGHTAHVNENDKISQEKAEELLKNDIEICEKALSKYCKVILTQNQYDACIDFIFNLGVGNFAKSTLLKLLNNKKFNEAANQFERWVFDINMRPLEGLKRRRKAEKELFLKKINSI